MRLHPDIERVALLGWHLYPTSRRTKAACLKGATDAATCNLGQIERWSNEFAGCNWRVVFGPSGLWCLDCDVPPGHAHDGIANLTALVNVHGPLPAGPQARSGGGSSRRGFAASRAPDQPDARRVRADCGCRL